MRRARSVAKPKPAIAINMARGASRQIVLCSIDGMFATDWSAEDVIDELWSDLMVVVEQAAHMNKGLAAIRDRASIGHDLNLDSPNFTISILDPAQCIGVRDFKRRVVDSFARTVAGLRDTASRLSQ